MMKVHIKDIHELYAAISDIQNVHRTLVLAAGTYTLSEIIDTVNAGRLELLLNMTLQGQPGHPEKVIIDASKLPDASFAPSTGKITRTGAIRMGYGDSKLEWLTVKGSSAPSSLSVIDTDLIDGKNSTVRIAHCIITGGRIGINIRNARLASDNRHLTAILEHNEIFENLVSLPGTQQGHGIIIQHANGVSNANIEATLKQNNVHHNIIGLKVFNNSNDKDDNTNNNTIHITSHADGFEENKLAVHVTGGVINLGGNKAVDSNTITIEAHGTTIKNNHGIRPDPSILPCGIFLAAGVRSATGAATSNNHIVLKLFGCPFAKNKDVDIIAFGAFSVTTFPPGHAPVPPPLPGTHNVVEIHLHGVSKKASRQTADCYPPEPVITNKVIVV